jgi:hypothetical protein
MTQQAHSVHTYPLQQLCEVYGDEEQEQDTLRDDSTYQGRTYPIERVRVFVSTIEQEPARYLAARQDELSAGCSCCGSGA